MLSEEARLPAARSLGNVEDQTCKQSTCLRSMCIHETIFFIMTWSSENLDQQMKSIDGSSQYGLQVNANQVADLSFHMNLNKGSSTALFEFFI